MNSESITATRQVNPVLKIVIEFGPLAMFFLANYKFGIFAATGTFMVATVISLILSKILLGKIAVIPLITGVFVLIFGTLTLYLGDETFIKLKPTIINCMFGAILFGGLLFNRPLLKPLLGEAILLDDMGWIKMTRRWGAFFFFMAMLNEFVWRSFSTDVWVNFKVFAIMPLTMIFAAIQIYLLQNHMLLDGVSGEGES